MKRAKPATMTIRNVVDSIFNSNAEWLDKNKPTLCFNHDGHDIKIPWECLNSPGWSTEHEIRDPKFLEAIDGLLTHFKETDTDYLDTDGKEGERR